MLFNTNSHHGLMMTAAGGDHSSFPERHFGSRDYSAEWTDGRDAEQSSNLHTNHWLDSTEPVAPKMNTLEPAFSTFYPQTWMDHASLSLHRNQNHLNLKLPASSPLPPPAHDIFSSPIQETTSSPVHQTELDMLWGQGLSVRSPSDFVWVPHGSTQSQGQQHHTSSNRGDDDESDSMWSLNDSLEDYFQPHHPSSWHAQPGAERLRRRSVPRITKPGASHNLHHPHSLRHTQALNGGRRVIRGSPGLTGTLGATAGVTTINTCLKQHHNNTRESRTSQSPNSDGEDDSSKLLSKKIAHKLSEKTRRNRLTMAIREIEKLLPPATTTTSDNEEEGKIHFIPGGNAISKVEVVEMAIGYIKRLREENKRMSKKIERAEASKRSEVARKEGDKSDETEGSKDEDTPDNHDETTGGDDRNGNHGGEPTINSTRREEDATGREEETITG